MCIAFVAMTAALTISIFVIRLVSIITTQPTLTILYFVKFFMIRLASLLVYNLGSPYLVHKLIIYASYQSGMRHLTLTLFLRSTDC